MWNLSLVAILKKYDLLEQVEMYTILTTIDHFGLSKLAGIER